MANKDENTLLAVGAIAGVLAAPAMTALGLLAMAPRSWAISVTWNWFAVPIFHLRALSFYEAFGIAIVFSLLAYHYQPQPKERTDGAGSRVFVIVVGPLLTVAVAWVVRYLGGIQ